MFVACLRSLCLQKIDSKNVKQQTPVGNAHVTSRYVSGCVRMKSLAFDGFGGCYAAGCL